MFTGETKLGSNANELLESYGILTHADCVLRTAYYKYLHPKEVFISHGVLQPELVAKKSVATRGTRNGREASMFGGKGGGLEIVYPHGSTLSVQRPARAVLSSGAISYPLNRCICAAWEGMPDSKAGRKQQRPRLVVLGSVEIFADEWIEKEENSVLADLVFKWLARDAAAPSFVSAHYASGTNNHESGDAEVARQRTRGNARSGRDTTDAARRPVSREEDEDEHLAAFELSAETHYADNLKDDSYQRVPDIGALASRLKPCLQEHEELPRDFAKLFDDTLFEFDTKMIPEVVAMYDVLKVKHEPLSLIPPTFETPLPPLQPATFPPTLHEPPNPPLDQFDLDEQFASSRERLAQLTNKCLPSGMLAKKATSERVADDVLELDDLEYYVREAGEIVGAMGRITNARSPAGLTAKQVLAFVLNQVVRFKMVNPPDVVKSIPVDKTRRLGQEVADDAKRHNVDDFLTSTEPTKKRQQLTHLDDAKATVLLDDDHPKARPVSRSGAFAAQPKIGFNGDSGGAEPKLDPSFKDTRDNIMTLADSK